MGHFAHQDNNSHINFILSSFFKKLNDLYKSESINSKKKIWIYSISMTMFWIDPTTVNRNLGHQYWSARLWYHKSGIWMVSGWLHSVLVMSQIVAMYFFG